MNAAGGFRRRILRGALLGLTAAFALGCWDALRFVSAPAFGMIAKGHAVRASFLLLLPAGWLVGGLIAVAWARGRKLLGPALPPPPASRVGGVLAGSPSFEWAVLAAPLLLVVAVDGQLASWESRDLFWTRSQAARPLASAIASLLDRDGDGFVCLMHGGECAEGNPAIHPLAPDRAGDHVDSNCDHLDGPPPHSEVGAAPYGFASAHILALRSRCRRMNVLVLAVDGLRADRMSGPEARDLRAFLALRQGGTWFPRAYAPAASAGRVIRALIEARSAPDRPLRAGTPPLAALSAKSYTSTFVGSRSALAEARDEGFDPAAHFDVVESVQDGSQVLARTRTVIEGFNRRRGRPWLLWVHLDWPETWSSFRDPHEAGRGAGDERRRRYHAAASIASRTLADLRRQLSAQRLRTRTLVVLVGLRGKRLDGEQAGEPLVAGTLRVPLVIYMPGQAAGKVPTVVGTASLLPTLVDLVERVPSPREGAPSLAPLVAQPRHAPAGAPAPVWISERGHRAVLFEHHALELHQPGFAVGLHALSRFGVAGDRNQADRDPDSVWRLLYLLGQGRTGPTGPFGLPRYPAAPPRRDPP